MEHRGTVILWWILYNIPGDVWDEPDNKNGTVSMCDGNYLSQIYG